MDVLVQILWYFIFLTPLTSNFRFCVANLKSSFHGIFNAATFQKRLEIAANDTFKLR